ncbi:MAG: YraN family protein [Actinomycetota bacterium]|jgi:putative endonuclease
MDARPELGRRGEDLAVSVFRRLGFEIVQRNYRCRHGEVDLIARRGRILVFCEVKTRRTDLWGIPAEAVDHRKQSRLRLLAALWLAEHAVGRVQVRFDVVSVIVRPNRNEITHIPDAF